MEIDNQSFFNIKSSSSKTFLVAGPCSVESEKQVMSIALNLVSHIHLLRGGIWKPRTRPGTFEGVGAEGLKWINNAGRAAGIPVAVEVATPQHVEDCLKIRLMFSGLEREPQ